MTVLEAIRRSAEFLEKKGVESARLNAELLLADVLKMPRMRLYLAFERMLTDHEIEVLRKRVVRRGRREPLQRIVGTTSFCGHEMLMDGNALIPRPETEALAETAFEFLAARQCTEGPPSVLDIGTGTGCIAIAVALKFPDAMVTGSDISPAALEVAARNAALHGLQDRLRLVRSDLFSGLPPGSAFDLIVSNPPYIATGEIQTLQPEVRDHEPALALDGGPDGLQLYRRLAVEASGWLKPRGRVLFEFGDGQDLALQKIFSSQNWIVEPPRADYTGRLRIIAAHRHAPD